MEASLAFICFLRLTILPLLVLGRLRPRLHLAAILMSPLRVHLLILLIFFVSYLKSYFCSGACSAARTVLLLLVLIIRLRLFHHCEASS